jgi:putative transposase
LALVIDCHTRELLGWQFSRSGRATTATAAALEQALIARFGSLGRVDRSFLEVGQRAGLHVSGLHPDGAQLRASTGVHHAALPQQNGMIERGDRTLTEQCVHRHRFETQRHASPVTGDWIRFYNTRRPHHALGMKTPAMAYALTAWPVQKTVGHNASIPI